ncbi:MAG: glycosyltransferase [Pseudomonadota bacterium]
MSFSGPATHPASPRVAAVVVTYNRPAELLLVVSALRHQSRPPEAIIVFDNAGPVPAAETLREYAGEIEIVRQAHNLGGAGGFAGGLQQAMAQGADWVWLMDDDAVPGREALAELLAVLPEVPGQTGVLCCAVSEFGALALEHRRLFCRWTGHERAIRRADYAKRLVEVDTASFVGFLVSGKAVRDAGLPNAEFFLAYDDTEYSLRLRQAGWRLWLVPGSRIDHVRIRASRLRASAFGPKHYFNIRNRLIVKRWYARFWGLALVRDIVFSLLLWIVCRGITQPGSLRLLVRALKDGLECRLGPFPAGINERR